MFRKTIYVRFDLNDYSIPPEAVATRSPWWPPIPPYASGMAPPEWVRHIRSYDRRQQVLDPSHREAVLKLKQRAFHATPAGRLEQG